MAVRLLSHASCPAVSSTPASRTSSLRALSSGPAPPAKQSSCTTSPSVTDKVLCVCGAVSDDGKPMVECTKCGAWSHLQCARLTQRTARKFPFFCHRCKSSSGGPATLAARRKGIEGVSSGVRGITKELPKSRSKTVLRPKSSSTQPSRPIPPPLSSFSSTNHQSSSLTSTSEPPSISSTSNSQPIVSVTYSQQIFSAAHSLQDVSTSALPDNIVSEPECSDNVPIVPIVHSKVTDAPSLTHEHFNSAIDAHCVSHNSEQTKSTHPDSDSEYIHKSEVINLLKKLESSIRVSVNIRLLSLEEEVSKLSHTVQVLENQCQKLSSNGISRSHGKLHSHSRPPPSSHSSSKAPNSRKVRSAHSNSLPFRVVWGTSRSCSSQVVQKALCALLPRNTHDSITVKGSFRQRGSRSVWWYTIMAPTEVMQQIVDVWHILEAKTSWSLRSSLTTHSRSRAVGQQSPYDLQTVADNAPIRSSASPTSNPVAPPSSSTTHFHSQAVGQQSPSDPQMVADNSPARPSPSPTPNPDAPTSISLDTCTDNCKSLPAGPIIASDSPDTISRPLSSMDILDHNTSSDLFLDQHSSLLSQRASQEAIPLGAQ